MSDRVTISEENEDQRWDDFIGSLPEGHYTQTASWGIVKATQGWRTLRVILWRGDTIIAGAQILWRTLFLGLKYGYVSLGPACREYNEDIIDTMIIEIKRVCADFGILYLALQPPRDGKKIEGSLLKFGFSPSHQGDLEKPATLRVNLTLTEDQIWGQIKSGRRKIIRHAMKNHLFLREADRTELETFYMIHMNTGERCHFDTQSLPFFESLWDVFHPRGMVNMFLCDYQGNTVAGSIAILYNGVLENYRYGWSGEYNRLYPNDAIVWYKILWGKGHGFLWYDFGGIDYKIARKVVETGAIPQDQLSSYSAYKLHFVDNIVFFPRTYEFIHHPFLRYFYNTLVDQPNVNALIKMIYGKLYRRR